MVDELPTVVHERRTIRIGNERKTLTGCFFSLEAPAPFGVRWGIIGPPPFQEQEIDSFKKKKKSRRYNRVRGTVPDLSLAFYIDYPALTDVPCNPNPSPSTFSR